jgi:hypothetical protein
MAMNSAPAPDATGEEAVERLPVELMANADTVPDPELLTKAKLAGIPGVPIVMGELLLMLHPFSERRGTTSATMNNRIDT